MNESQKIVAKKELIERAAHLAGERVQTTEKVVDGILMALQEYLISGELGLTVEVGGFGVLAIRELKAITGLRQVGDNVFDGIPARRKIRFRAGRRIKTMYASK